MPQVYRHYDEKSGLWHTIYWDEILNCWVNELELGQVWLQPEEAHTALITD